MNRPLLRSIILADLLLALLALAAFQRATHQAALPASFPEEESLRMEPFPDVQSLLPGDLLLTLQGLSLTEQRQVKQVLGDIRSGETVTLEVQRGTSRVQLSLATVQAFTKRYLTTKFLVGFLFLALGAWVLWKRPDDLPALLLHACLMPVGFMVFYTSNRFLGAFSPLSQAIDLLNFVVEPLVGALFLHLTLVFPSRKWAADVTRLPLALLYLAAGLSGLWAAFTCWKAGYPLSLDWYRRFNGAYQLSGSLLCLGAGAAILNLLHSFWTAGDPDQKRKLRWVLTGVGTGPVLFLALWQVPDMMGKPTFLPEEIALALLGTVPVCFSIAIIQHRLLGIDLVLKRGLFFALLAGVSLLFFELTRSWLATAAAAVLVAVLFEAQESQKLNRMKSFFLAGVSHDLKTPLANIRLYAELLGGKGTAKERKEFSDIVVGESDRLTRLIDNVLDFSRIEGGTRTYGRKATELNAIVERVLGTFRYQFRIGGFQCRQQLAKGSLLFVADADAVAEALVNLLNNALKYSGDSKRVTVSTFRREDWVGVTVADEGIGIDPADQKRIFEPFLRLGTEATRSSGGAGLGLSLVRHILEGNAGKVEVESGKGKGSRFTLLFKEGTA